MRDIIRHLRLLAPAASILIFSSGAGAAPITGIANINGTASVSATTIDFLAGAVAPPNCSSSVSGSSRGCFNEAAPSTGSFSTLTLGQFGGLITDLTGPPISGNISLSNWANFAAPSSVIFDLTRVTPGGAPSCASVNTSAGGVQCTPVIGGQVSPFTLVNSADGTNAAVFFNVLVNGYTGTTGTGVTQYLGAFSTQSAGTNIAGILAAISAGSSITASYSATFSPTGVPEPGSLALMGTGLIALGLVSRRRRPRS